MRQKSSLERYLDAVERAGEATLRCYFQKQMIKESLFSAQERQKLVDDVANQVLSRLSVTVDASQVFDAIDGIKERLDNLCK